MDILVTILRPTMLGEIILVILVIIVIIVIIVIMIIIVIINMMIRCDCNDGWEGRRCERKVFELDALLVFSIQLLESPCPSVRPSFRDKISVAS